MNIEAVTLASLFKQLGLESSIKAINEFVKAFPTHSESTTIHESDFWTPSQSSFLKEAIADDSEWANAADQLNSLLKQK